MSVQQRKNAAAQLGISRDYVRSGISVIPLRIDGSKAPAVRSWNEYRKRFATDAELRSWFSEAAGIGIVCGVQSGGLEVLDFDERADENIVAWKETLPADLLARLCIVETGGVGYHILYRCSVISGNTKIAMSATNGVLVESRGEGGYIVGVGSVNHVHASGRPYVQVSGRPLPEIGSISAEQRKAMWRAAASFDERADPMADYARQRLRELRPVIKPDVTSRPDATTPWDDYDMRADWADILKPAGWSTHDGKIWTRPGKRFGTSAKIVAAKDGSLVLTVFSTNAGVLAPDGTGHRTWGKFAAFAVLHHDGDRRAAARAVRAIGYGRTGK